MNEQLDVFLHTLPMSVVTGASGEAQAGRRHAVGCHAEGCMGPKP